LAAELEQFARSRLTPRDLEPVLEIHGEVQFCDITPQLYQELGRFEPFGMGNPQPRFVIRSARLLAPAKIVKEKHLKLRLGATTNGSKFVRAWDAIGWRMAAEHSNITLGETVDVAFTLDENTHPEFGGLQLSVIDLRRTAESIAAVTMAKAAQI
jgi:single-stranded-DNA-specific exonuclease